MENNSTDLTNEEYLERNKKAIAEYNKKAEETVNFLKKECSRAKNAKARLLLVDDERTIRDSYSLGLRELGYEAYLAENGQEALEKIFSYPAESGFNAVLVDNHMPVMSGEDFVKNIRQNPKYNDYSDMKVISIGHPPSEEVRPMYDAFLKKPLELDEMDSTLEKVLLE
ncbi:response regulator [Candidatus Pacearchaeota archaeon]|nr:response regulator [Candidatus Pacearchaeota archaeon]